MNPRATFRRCWVVRTAADRSMSLGGGDGKVKGWETNLEPRPLPLPLSGAMVLASVRAGWQREAESEQI